MTAIILNRLRHDANATLGALYLPGPLFKCWTLERAWADNAPNVSCIPAGEYPLRLRSDLGWSKKLGRPVVEIFDVPGRSLILFHPANWWWQLEGCVAPGLTEARDETGGLAVSSSGAALALIEPHLAEAAERGGRILITDEQP